MSLQTLQANLKASSSTDISEAMITNAGLTPRPGLDALLQSVFMLSGTLNVNVKSVGDVDDTSLTIQATGSFLNLQNVDPIQIQFILNQNIIDVIIDATLFNNQGGTWQFADSFPYMVIYPFYNLSFDSSHFIFSSYAQPYVWQSYNLSLVPGLNFASLLHLSENGFIGLASNFFATPPNGEILFTGTVDSSVIDRTTVVWPSVALSGSLSDQPSQFIPGLEFSNPIIALTTQVDPTDHSQSYSLDFSVTEDHIELTLVTQLKNNSVVGFNIVPSDVKNPPSLEDVVKLINQKDAGSVLGSIPPVLAKCFEEITFASASCTICTTPFNIISMSLVLSAGKDWPFTNEFTIDSLTLSYTVLNPFGGTTIPSITIFGFNGELTFYPTVFNGKFDLQISVDITNNNLLISGSYQGTVNLNTLLQTLGISIPSQFSSINFTNFNVNFNEVNDAWIWSLFCSAEETFSLPFVQGNVDCNISVSLSQGTCQLEGGLTIGSSYFNISYDSTGGNTTLQGFWISLSENDLLGIEDIANAVGIEITVPPVFDLNLKSATFQYDLTQNTFILTADSQTYGQATFKTFLNKDNQTHGFFFNLNVQSDIVVLSQGLPLIGSEFSSTNQIALDNLSITYASTSSTNALNPPGTFNAGLDIQGVLSIAGSDNPFDFNFSSSEQQYETNLLTAPAPTSNSPPGVWIDIQKSVGPINLKRIGLNYQDSLLWVMLDASLNTTALDISLTGLSVGIKPSTLDPDLQFALQGLDVDLNSDELVINGGLLSVNNNGITEYDGTLTVKAGEFELAALASYSTTAEGQPSLFAFAVIDIPLGGPPPFFITGFAGGFGYNRNLVMPALSSITSFPLIEIALDPSQYKNQNLSQLLTSMQSAIPIEQGQNWLAAGITFTSYEMANSYLLVAVTFGTQLEIDFFGMSTISTPPLDPNPVAMVQFAIEGTIAPQEGLFSVEGQLTNNSYILSKDCKLTGGFAFYVWYGPNPHAGDFVICIGGYGPLFKKPNYYPTVPLLGLNWQVDNLSIQGGLYFAITSQALMVGGSLKAVWQSDGIRAWFDLEADILLFWHPYRYTIEASVDIGASVKINVAFVNTTLTVHIGADLNIWGPDFTGIANIKLYIVSFTISFGNTQQTSLPTTSWSQFKTSYLSAGVCTLNLTQGAIKTGVTNQGITYDWVVDPEHFMFTTGSFIPSKTLTLNEGIPIDLSTITTDNGVQINTDIGVGMVRVASEDFTSEHIITLTYDFNNYDMSKFNQSYMTTNSPQSLWQCITSLEDLESSVANSDSTTIANTFSGLSFSAKTTPSDQSVPVLLENLLYSTDFDEPLIAYLKPSVPTTDSFNEEASEEIQQTVSQNTLRTDILTCLQNTSFKVIDTVNVTDLSANADNGYFVGTPLLSYLGEEKALGEVLS